MRLESSPDRPIEHGTGLRVVVRFLRRLRLKIATAGKLQAGNNVYFGAGAVIKSPDFATFGNDVAVGRDFHVEANLRVGSGVLISSRVAIIGNDHQFDADDAVYWGGRLPPSTVTIEGDVLIGFGAIIIGDVTIHQGCVVGAGSVVTRDLPPDTVCIGAPAAPIRKRQRGARS